jgi:Flp pilus assembly pilin Flp
LNTLIQQFLRKEDGIQTVEIVIILVAAVALAALLRQSVSSWIGLVSDHVISLIYANT